MFGGGASDEASLGDGSARAEVALTHRPLDVFSARQRALLLGALFLIGTSSYVDRNVIGVLLEPIKNEFGVSDTALGLLTGISFALFYATLGLPAARWADYGNRKRIIVLALSIWSVMTAFSGLAQTFWQLTLIRVGVGAGEAGAVPAAQSLICDYYPPQRRAKALGIFMLSAVAGGVFGLLAGGWIAQHYGWRTTFVAVGLPGLALAIIAQLALGEPRLQPAYQVRPQYRETTRVAFLALFHKPSYRNIVYGMVMYWLVAYGALIFTPSVMIRTHGLDVAHAGALYGLVSAVGALIGTLLGGGLADRLAPRDVAWLCRLPAIALIAAVPLYQSAYLVGNVKIMAGILFFATILLIGVASPMFAALQLICGSHRRASAVAIASFFANLIGLGVGPLLTGLLSDLLARTYGAPDGLRYALIIVVLAFLPCAYFMLRASRNLKNDAEE